MKLLYKAAVATLVVVPLLVGCTTKPAQEKADTAAASPVPSGVETSIVPGSVKDFETNVGDTVHFDYDRSEILENDRVILQRQAAWLTRYPSVRVTIEGNCDERGTREYNLALGARRAQAVKEFLVSEGVSARRVTTISYGKERPICTESSDMCWERNRRGVTAISPSSA